MSYFLKKVCIYNIIEIQKLFSHFQNAWQNERPEEFVEHIQLNIPSGADVENPIEDATFMEQIGAKIISGTMSMFELRNAVTGTRFTFKLSKQLNGSVVTHSICTLRRKVRL